MSAAATTSGVLQREADQTRIRKLMWFFALVYVAEGAGQADFGLIAQPLNYYLKEVYQWTPVEIAAYLTVLNFPWFIKPLYGAVSDFVPLFGYRRKTYLVLAGGAAAMAYFLIAGVSAPGSIIVLLLLTAYGMAIASTLSGALLVENGQKFGASAVFVNQQWLWYNVAQMTSAVLGGLLIAYLTPISAVHVAAILVGFAPLAVIFGSLKLVEEEKSTISLGGLRETLAGVSKAFGKRELWIIAAFLFFYYFSPGFVTPLYFYLTDTLKFSQAFIGVFNAIQYAGWIAAALIDRRYLSSFSPKALLNISIFGGVLATSSFLLISGPVMAVFANFCYGMSQMIMVVATLSLAADHCPKRAEGFAFAALISVTNLSSSLADNVGSFLYQDVFHERLSPLIVVSAAFTAVTVLLVPMLRLSRKGEGEFLAATGAE